MRIITQEQLGTIGRMIGINNKNIPIRTHIKIFKIWMKSRKSHLLPISIIEKYKKSNIYTNIKKINFPQESAAPMGLSFYETFIKPLLKIKDK